MLERLHRFSSWCLTRLLSSSRLVGQIGSINTEAESNDGPNFCFRRIKRDEELTVAYPGVAERRHLSRVMIQRLALGASRWQHRREKKLETHRSCIVRTIRESKG